jgi:hypothetical protein
MSAQQLQYLQQLVMAEQENQHPEAPASVYTPAVIFKRSRLAQVSRHVSLSS